MSRVDSARHRRPQGRWDAAAEMKLAEPLTKGSVVASDAFFPVRRRHAGLHRGPGATGRDPARRIAPATRKVIKARR